MVTMHLTYMLDALLLYKISQCWTIVTKHKTIKCNESSVKNVDEHGRIDFILSSCYFDRIDSIALHLWNMRF